MTKKLFAFTIAMLIVFGASPVFAANISVSTLVDVDKKEIMVSGDAVGNTLITVVALDVPKDDAKIIFDNSNEAIDGTVDELIALKQVYSDGTYGVIIGMPSDAPKCKYEVYVTAAGEKVSDDFIYYDGEIADDKVELMIYSTFNIPDSIITIKQTKKKSIFKIDVFIFTRRHSCYFIKISVEG